MKTLISILCPFIFIPLSQLIRGYGVLMCRMRGYKPRNADELRTFTINSIVLQEYEIVVEGHSHLITEAGNSVASPENTIVLMGGIPTDPSETFHWLVASLCRSQPALRCLIVHLPFAEAANQITLSNVLAHHSPKRLPFNDPLDWSHKQVDQRYNHKFQAVRAFEILKELNIRRAHFVGHDRGAVVFDYMIASHPDIAISYSRGSQLWDYYEEQWSEMAPALIVGPPHRQMGIPWQSRILFFAVVVLGKPINLISPGARAALKKSEAGTENFHRETHLIYQMLCICPDMLLKLQQSFMQTDSQEEVANRESLISTSVPIMQFQGEDEFAFDKKGTLVSDQPYFGKYNLFRNDVEDLYPGEVGQVANNKQEQFVGNVGEYKLLKLKPNARMSRFALIPNSAHFNVIENPSGCAKAILDFTSSRNT